MLCKLLMITFTGMAFGLHQDLEMQAVQLQAHLPLVEVPIQLKLSPLESNIIDAAQKKYPHTFINDSYKLLKTDHKAMARLIPQIEALRTGHHPFKWSMDHTFYSQATFQMLYVASLLAWAFATHQDPAVTTVGLLYEALLMSVIIAKHVSVNQRDRLLKEHVELIKSCSRDLEECDQSQLECEATLEHKINQALKDYQADLKEAHIGFKWRKFELNRDLN